MFSRAGLTKETDGLAEGRQTTTRGQPPACELSLLTGEVEHVAKQALGSWNPREVLA
jgi:hypothetical protein